MKLGIMQPYFLPYIGYFQLIKTVDIFVIYDNIKYTKKGWINRNRILINGKGMYITLPLKKDSDSLNVDQRYLSNTFSVEKRKLLRQVEANYRKAPYFSDVIELFRSILDYCNPNLFYFVLNSLKLVCEYINVHKEFVVSSTLPVDHTLKGEDKVLAICKEMKANSYVNPEGGVKLYSRKRFIENDINLCFLSANPISYPQFNSIFVPNMSILDVLMFNSREKITYFLEKEYTLA